MKSYLYLRAINNQWLLENEVSFLQEVAFHKCHTQMHVCQFLDGCTDMHIKAAVMNTSQKGRGMWDSSLYAVNTIG